MLQAPPARTGRGQPWAHLGWGEGNPFGRLPCSSLGAVPSGSEGLGEPTELAWRVMVFLGGPLPGRQGGQEGGSLRFFPGVSGGSAEPRLAPSPRDRGPGQGEASPTERTKTEWFPETRNEVSRMCRLHTG